MGDPSTGLVEREDELRRGRERLALAVRGEGGVLLVEGTAGAGKTALLRALRADAAERGFTVLTAVGSELERDFPFGLVRQLFEPRVATAPAEERQRLLAGAAAMAAPLVGGVPSDAEAGGDASFATLDGLYWLTAGLAETAPLVLVVDDAHWGDAPSLRFLEFLARRAEELRVLVAVGTRPHGRHGRCRPGRRRGRCGAADQHGADRPGGAGAHRARHALRRAGERTAARAVLTLARADAHRAEAAALERLVVEELVIAGGRPRRSAATGVEALTPAERRVAEHAATGMSNRETAEALFVTRKTVETTLGHAYTKLGIRSRTQVAEALEPEA